MRTGESIGNDSQLTLSVTSLDLFGEYKCIASNIAGNDSNTTLLNGKGKYDELLALFLTILGTFSVTILPARLNVLHFGDSINLNCTIDERINPDMVFYTWKFYGNIINHTLPFININYDHYSSTNQRGEYQCFAFNNDLSARGTSPDVFVAFAPVLVNEPMSVKTIANDTVEFICTAFGYPTPTIQWRRINTTEEVPSLEDIDDLSVNLPLNAYNISYSGLVNETSTLRIYPVNYHDFGYYICIATLFSSDIVFATDCCSSNDSSNSTIKDYNAISNIATLTGTDRDCLYNSI